MVGCPPRRDRIEESFEVVLDEQPPRVVGDGHGALVSVRWLVWMLYRLFPYHQPEEFVRRKSKFCHSRSVVY